MPRMRWLFLAGVVAVLASLAFVVAACGDETATGPAATEPAGDAGTRLEVSARNVAFDTDRLVVPAGESFTVVFDNQDSGVPHNFAIYTDEGADEVVAATEIKNGPDVQVLEVEGLEAGEYFYRCDVHPTAMTGTLVVQ